MRITSIFALVALMVAASSARAENIEVKIENFTFNPPQIMVHVGDTVTWVNHDDIPHTVMSKGQGFRSKVLDSDEKFSFTFAAPGSFSYFCSLHPHMTGAIVVEAAAK